jgi:hypothetical protein
MRWEERREFAADRDMEDGKSETEIWRKIIWKFMPKKRA